MRKYMPCYCATEKRWKSWYNSMDGPYQLKYLVIVRGLLVNFHLYSMANTWMINLMDEKHSTWQNDVRGFQTIKCHSQYTPITKSRRSNLISMRPKEGWIWSPYDQKKVESDLLTTKRRLNLISIRPKEGSILSPYDQKKVKSDLIRPKKRRLNLISIWPKRVNLISIRPKEG